MAITLTAAATNSQRQGACNAIVDLLDVGAGTSRIDIRDGAVVAVSINLPNPAFGAATLATPSVATANGLPLSGVAGAAVPAADNFIVYDRNGLQVWDGTVTATGGGGDLTLDNVIIALGQTVTINTWTFSQ